MHKKGPAMSELIIKAAWGLMSKLLTEAFIGRALVYSLSSLAKSTENQLDDQIVGAVADAIGIKKPD